MTIEIIEKSIDEIVPYENNPRHNDNAVDKLAKSIKEYGFLVPIIVDKNNIILAGHTRYKASKKLGLKTVPVVVAKDLNEIKSKEFRIVDNRVGEYATWDEDLLRKELEEIADSKFNDFYEFDNLIAQIQEDEEEEDDKYSKAITIPTYQVQGIKDIPLSALVNKDYFNKLNKEIDESSVPDDVKEFLRLASYRHERSIKSCISSFA